MKVNTKPESFDISISASITGPPPKHYHPTLPPIPKKNTAFKISKCRFGAAFVFLAAVCAALLFVFNSKESSSTENGSPGSTPTPSTPRQGSIRIKKDEFSVINVTIFRNDQEYPVSAVSDTSKEWVGSFLTVDSLVDTVLINGNGKGGNLYLYDVLVARLSGSDSMHAIETIMYTSTEEFQNEVQSQNVKRELQESDTESSIILLLPTDSQGKVNLNINIKAGTYVGIVGVADVIITGNLTVSGTLSVVTTQMTATDTNMYLLSDEASVIVTGSLVHQQSCPEGWIEYPDTCLYQQNMPLLTLSQAVAFCESFGAAITSLPMLETMSAPDVTLISGQTFWLNTSDCVTLAQENTLEVQKGQACDEVASVFCRRPVQRVFQIENRPVHFVDSEIIFPTYSSVTKHISDDVYTLSTNSSFSWYEETGKEDGMRYEIPAGVGTISTGITVSYEGQDSILSVAIDTVPIVRYGVPSKSETMFGAENHTLPSRVHIHLPESNEAAEACVSQVTVNINDELALSFSPSEMYEDCSDFNVCESGSDACQRSLMQLDTIRNCAILGNGPGLSRDLVIDFTRNECYQLTTWRHADLGEEIYAEIELANDTKSNAFIRMNTFGESLNFKTSLKVPLLDFPKIPTSFDLVSLHHESIHNNSSPSFDCVSKVSFKQYGKTIAKMDITIENIYDCIGMCKPFANSTCIKFGGSDGLLDLTVDLINDIACNKLVSGTAVNDTLNIVDACTADPINIIDPVSTLDEQYMSSLLNFGADEDYRTLVLVAQSDINETETTTVDDLRSILIPPNRALHIIGANLDITGYLNIRIAKNAVLYLEGLNLLGKVNISNSGELEMVGCILAFDRSSFSISNYDSGYMVLSRSICEGDKTSIVNHGEMLALNSKFRDGCSVDTTTGILKVSDIQTYDSFELVGDVEIIGSSRAYDIALSENGFICGDVQDGDILEIETKGDAYSCQAACDKEVSCSGFGLKTTGLEIGTETCGLCLRQGGCSFDCSKYQYLFEARDLFLFTQVPGCTDYAKLLKDQLVGTLPKCKAWCSYTGFCEGFVYEMENQKCSLYTDIHISPELCSRNPLTLYIRYSETASFYKLPRTISFVRGSTLPLASFSSKSSGECNAICDITEECEAFVHNRKLPMSCSLYGTQDVNISSDFHGPNEEYYVSLAKTFPIVEYFKVKNECFLPGFYVSVVALSVSECRRVCDVTYGCKGFGFSTSTSGPSDGNCILYQFEQLLLGKVGLDPLCSPGFNLYIAFAETTFTDYHVQANDTDDVLFGEAGTTETDIVVLSTTFERCLALCFYEDGCQLLSYNSTAQACLLGSDDIVIYRSSSMKEYQYFQVQNVRYDSFQDGTTITTSGDELECKMLCDFHRSCVAFITVETECHLLSQISISDQGQYQSSVINIAIANRFRQNMIEAVGQCLLPITDLLRERNRFVYGALKVIAGADYNGNYSTPSNCQEYCLEKGYAFYGVNGRDCFCDDKVHWLNISAHRNYSTREYDQLLCPDGLRTQCSSIGRTNLPQRGISLIECKQRCLEAIACVAVLYDQSTKECTFSSSALFESCEGTTAAAPEEQLFVQWFEHYYEVTPSVRREYTTLLRINVTDGIKLGFGEWSLDGCQSLCDVHSDCEAVYFDETVCEILDRNTMDSPPLLETQNISVTSIYIAQDVQLYTRALGWCPMEGPIATISGISDVAVCKTLCEFNVDCESLSFLPNECTLFPRSTLSQPCQSESSKPYYISFQRFAEASNKYDYIQIEEFCFVSTFVLGNPKYTRNVWECKQQCDQTYSCSGVTFNSANYMCILMGSTNLVSSSCVEETVSFLRFDSATFLYNENVCIVDKNSGISFQGKTAEECAALCESWFNCRTFSVQDDSQECILYETQDTEACIGGGVYEYYSEIAFTRLDSQFCVASNDEAALAKVEDIPIEACKKLCSIIKNCRSFEHSADGKCVMFPSSDFSLPCPPDNDRDLYVSLQDYVNSDTSAYKFDRQDRFCFDTDIEKQAPVQDAVACELKCLEQQNCLGFQFVEDVQCNEMGDCKYENLCFIMETDIPEITRPCSTGEFVGFRYLRNPYSIRSNACLRNEISLTRQDTPPQGQIQPYRFYNKDVYECMALCDALPQCAHFVYGDPENATGFDEDFLKANECKFFGTQAEELDNCDNFEGPLQAVQAYVNIRAFIDTFNVFGFPEKKIIIPEITFQGCAALCNNLETCNAFTHNWDYRKFADKGAVSMFEPTRLFAYEENFSENSSVVGFTFDDDERTKKMGWNNLSDTTLAFGVDFLTSEALLAFPGNFYADAYLRDSQKVVLVEEEDDYISIAFPNMDLCLYFNQNTTSYEEGTAGILPKPCTLNNVSSLKMRKIVDPTTGLFSLISDDGWNVGINYDTVDKVVPERAPTVAIMALVKDDAPFFNKMARNWTFMSDTIQMRDEVSGFCLAGINKTSAEVKMAPCSSTSLGQSWVYVHGTRQITLAGFQVTGVFNLAALVPGILFDLDVLLDNPVGAEVYRILYKAIINTNVMRCLTRDISDNTLYLTRCRATDPNQKWEHDTVERFLRQGEYCIGTGLNATACNVRNVARWSRYSECKLTTREKSKPMKLEHAGGLALNGCILKNETDNELTYINILGMGCEFYTLGLSLIDETAQGNDGGLLPAEFEYFYSKNAERIQLVNSSKCLGIGDSVAPTDYIPDAVPVFLVECFDEDNVLNLNARWNVATTYPNVGSIVAGSMIEDKQYCLEPISEFFFVVGIHAVPCNSYSRNFFFKDGVPVLPAYWRAIYENPVRVYVKPDIISAGIDDERLQYKIWYASQESRLVREFRIKQKSFDRKIKGVVSNLEAVSDSLEGVYDLLEFKGGPLQEAVTTLGSASSLFSTLGVSLKAIEYIPFIGQAIKLSGIRIFCKGMSTGTSKSGGAIGKWITRFKVVAIKALSLSGTLSLVIATVLKVSQTIADYGNTLIDEAYKGYMTGNVTYTKRTNMLLEDALYNMNALEVEIMTLEQRFAFTAEFPASIQLNFDAKFSKFTSGFSGVFFLADKFDWINTALDYPFRIPYPTIRWDGCLIRIFGTCILPRPVFGYAYLKIKIRDIIRVWEDIQNFLRSIPGVGWLIRKIEGLLAGIAEKLFEFTGIDTPDFDIPTGFIDDFSANIDLMETDLLNLDVDLNGLVTYRILGNIGGGELLSQVNELLEPVEDVLDDAEALAEKFAEIVSVPELNTTLQLELLDSSIDVVKNLLNDNECEYTDIEIPNLLFPGGPGETFSMCTNIRSGPLTSNATRRILAQISDDDELKQLILQRRGLSEPPCPISISLHIPLQPILYWGTGKIIESRTKRKGPWSWHNHFKKARKRALFCIDFPIFEFCPQVALNMVLMFNQRGIQIGLNGVIGAGVGIRTVEKKKITEEADISYVGPETELVYALKNINILFQVIRDNEIQADWEYLSENMDINSLDPDVTGNDPTNYKTKVLEYITTQRGTLERTSNALKGFERCINRKYKKTQNILQRKENLKISGYTMSARCWKELKEYNIEGYDVLYYHIKYWKLLFSFRGLDGAEDYYASYVGENVDYRFNYRPGGTREKLHPTEFKDLVNEKYHRILEGILRNRNTMKDPYLLAIPKSSNEGDYRSELYSNYFSKILPDLFDVALAGLEKVFPNIDVGRDNDHPQQQFEYFMEKDNTKVKTSGWAYLKSAIIGEIHPLCRLEKPKDSKRNVWAVQAGQMVTSLFWDNQDPSCWQNNGGNAVVGAGLSVGTGGNLKKFVANVSNKKKEWEEILTTKYTFMGEISRFSTSSNVCPYT